MSRPADDAAREAALDPARSFIVRAPAGSGKTELLIRRYLALLATVDHPEEVIAITFTRKAAAEMRQRVLAALASPPAGRPGELARALLGRDWRLGDNPARLRILTIDALNRRLAGALPIASGGSGAARALDDAEPLYRTAARRMLALVEDGERRWADAAATLIDHLDGAVDRAVELIALLLARRDQWLTHVAGIPTDRARLEQAWRDVSDDWLRRADAAFGTDERAALEELAAFAAGHLDDASPLAPWRRRREFPVPRWAELERWRGLAWLLLTGDGQWRKQVNVKTGFPPVRELKPHKDRMKALLDELGGRESLREALVQVRTLPDPRYDDGAWGTLSALTTVLPLAAAELDLLFARSGEADFVDVARGALAALGEPESPTDLALALDHRIRHLLVDEFQDTSWRQLELVRRLTAGWTQGDGRTLFLVGDPMQSIYRFRQAEVGIFLEAARSGIGDVDLEPLELSANFRSRPALIDWVNGTFGRILPAAADAALGAVPHTPSSWPGGDGGDDGAVRCHALIDPRPGDEPRLVVEIVRGALDETTHGSVAILVRTRTHMGAIVRALRAHGIDFAAVDAEPLAARPEVRDLRALTAALRHPADDFAWCAVLRSPAVGLTLADLHALRAGGATLSERVFAEPFDGNGLSADGGARVAHLRGALAAVMAARLRQPLHELVHRAWCRLGGAAVTDAAGLANARTYLDLLAFCESGGDLVDETAFDRALEHRYGAPGVSGRARVQLMTIHGAKGLQFDTVIVPALERRPRGDDPELLAFDDVAGSGLREIPLLAPLPRRGEDSQEAMYRFLRDLEKRRDRLESQRLLYVACTRAERRLHLIGSAVARENGIAAPAADSLLAHLWPVVREDFRGAAERERTTPSAAAPDDEGGMVLRRLPAGWSPPPMAADVTGPGPRPTHDIAAPEFLWAGERARLTGIAIHRLLQRVIADGGRGWSSETIATRRPAIVGLLRQLGLSGTALDASVEDAVAALIRTLTDPRGRWLLLDDQRERRAEWALTAVDGDRRRRVVLDLTFVDGDGRRWIVDFKTGSHEGGSVETFLDNEQVRYRDQLESYARIVSAMDERPIRAGLYFPLIGGWREWDPAIPAIRS